MIAILNTITVFFFLTFLSINVSVSAKKEDNSKYVFNQSEYNPVIKLLDDELKTVKLSYVLNQARYSTTKASDEMKDTPWFLKGFRWSQQYPSDETSEYWQPQGISSSDDGSVSGDGVYLGSTHVLMVSWTDIRNRTGRASSPSQGVRISVVRKGADDEDVMNRAYIHLLLVEPYMDDKTPNYRTLSNVNSGGLVWRDNWIYITDDVLGLRVFDLNHIYKVASTDGPGTIGFSKSSKKYLGGEYEYIVPQAHTLKIPKFSAASASIDSSYTNSKTADLILGESTSDETKSAFIRLPLSNETNLPQNLTASWAWKTSLTHAEGIAWVPKPVMQYFVSVNDADDVRSDLHRWTPGTYSSEYRGRLPNGVQGVAYRPATPGELWVVGSIVGHRYVMALNMDMRNLTDTNDPTPTVIIEATAKAGAEAGDKPGPKTGAIAGGVGGGMAALLLLTGVAVIWRRRKQKVIIEEGFVKPELGGVEASPRSWEGAEIDGDEKQRVEMQCTQITIEMEA